MNAKWTILKQVLQENKKCVAEPQSAKQSIEHGKKAVSIELSQENLVNATRKTIFQNSLKRNFSHNKKVERSYGETNQVHGKIASLRTGINVSTSEMQGDDNIDNLRKDINNVSMSGLYEGSKHIKKQFRYGKGKLFRRDIATESVAFSAYLDHYILHMGQGHHIICNQVLLNDGGHYNSFTGTFTVPQTGVYLLTFYFGVQHINDVTEIRLVVNNREIVDAEVQVLGTFQGSSSSNTAIIRLNQGESVWLENMLTDSEVISSPGYRYTTFSGVLLY